MRSTILASVLLEAIVVSASPHANEFLAPGRVSRMFEKRGNDHGTFQIDCQNSEAACNNACYYIRCQAQGDPNANLITYQGSDSQTSDKNRRESGCQVNNPAPASGSSMCTNFPFSQAFSNPTATNYQCDEWPPALAKQDDFNNKKFKNTLRCMPGNENGSLGGKLANIITSNNIQADDTFRVDFVTKIGSVSDKSRVNYCQPQLDCTQDGWEIVMSEKQIGGGKIESPYFAAKDNNKYKTANTPYDDLYQCSVELERDGDSDLKNIKLFDWANTPQGNTATCTLNNDGDTCTVSGLPVGLQIKRTGAARTKLEFEYAPGQSGANVNYFSWDSDQSGNGRGPWTNADSNGVSMPLRYCKVQDKGTNDQTMECWFPCYKSKDGR